MAETGPIVRFTDPDFGAWLGWNEVGRLVAIELEGFHTELFKIWASRFQRAQIVDEDEAIRQFESHYEQAIRHREGLRGLLSARSTIERSEKDG